MNNIYPVKIGKVCTQQQHIYTVYTTHRTVYIAEVEQTMVKDEYHFGESRFCRPEGSRDIAAD